MGVASGVDFGGIRAVLITPTTEHVGSAATASILSVKRKAEEAYPDLAALGRGGRRPVAAGADTLCRSASA